MINTIFQGLLFGMAVMIGWEIGLIIRDLVMMPFDRRGEDDG